MAGAISGVNPYFSNFSIYGGYKAPRSPAQSGEAAGAAHSGRTASVWTSRPAASPETPVEPVSPVRAVNGERAQPVRLGPVLREGADPAEMAVRMRMKPYEASSAQAGEKTGENGETGKVGAGGAQAAAEEGKCQTCEERKYQDGSDDMGVSFQTPTRVAPEQAASAVRGHENEHVVREQAKAQREDRRVVSQSVTLHNDICPECGKVYVSGGVTRTVTAAERETEQQVRQEQQEQGAFSVFG